jgi:hypothetical protein
MTKRMRIEVPLPWAEVDAEKLRVKNVGKEQPMCIVLNGTERLRFTLTPSPSDWVTIANFGLHDKFNQPGFLRGEPAGGKDEFLNMEVHLGDERADFMKSIGRVIATQLAEHSPAQWKDAAFKDCFKAKVFLSGGRLTTLKIVEDEEVHTGRGWSFLQPFMQKHTNFSDAEAKMVIEAQPVWIVDGKAGVNFHIVQLALRPKPAVDYFPDNDLLA